MKMNYIFISCFYLFLLTSCAKEERSDGPASKNINEHLQKLTEARTASERNDDLINFLSYYDESVISMPEYQPALTGIKEVEAFYKEIFQRQNIKSFDRIINEVIDLGNTVIEIGTFKKEYTDSKTNTALTQNGKYWNVWDVKSDGSFKLKGEAFGFFHPVEDPRALVVHLNQVGQQSPNFLNNEIPFELKAYNALMEKGVRTRDGVLRAEFFTNDGSFMPFADTTVTGKDKIKPYLVAYSSRGDVTIDSIAVYTYHSENFDDYILEYPKFMVRWTVPQFSGRTEGKGIRIWKRQKDKSLKIYREIGTHNHLE